MVAIQNAVELLSKSILLDVNELIVFNLDIESDSAVCTMLRNQFHKNVKRHIWPIMQFFLITIIKL